MKNSINKKIVISVGITLLLIIVLNIYTSLLLRDHINIVNNMDTNNEVYIQTQINEANYCEVASDCVRITSKCPFGCNVYVNKKNIENINVLVESYKSTCLYKCLKIENVACIENRCVAQEKAVEVVSASTDKTLYQIPLPPISLTRGKLSVTLIISNNTDTNIVLRNIYI